MSTHVTLVHGTWAPDAPWTRSGSPLRLQLEKKLGPGLIFHEHRWSGANSHEARLEGGRTLATALRQNIAGDAGGDHFILSHSHGGNVAVYALRELIPSERKAIAGVVCLATPFLRCSAADVSDGLGMVEWTLPIFAAAVPFLVLAVPGGLLADRQAIPDAIATILLVAGLLSPIVAFRRARRWLKTTARRRVQTISASAVQRLETPVLSNIPFFCVKLAGDEAKLAIGTAVAAGAAPRWGWERLPLLLPHIGNVIAGFVAFGFFSAVGTGLYQGFTNSTKQPLDFLMPVLIPAIGIVVVVLFGLPYAIVLGLPIVAALSQLRQAALGRGSLNANPWLDVGQYDVPLTDPPVTSRGYAFSSLGLSVSARVFRSRGFVHSILYQNEAVQADIALWMSERQTQHSHVD